MKRVGCIVIIATIALVVVFFFVPLWKVPYFEAESLKYEAISNIERGQPSEIKDYLDWFKTRDVVPHPFPIARVIIKNVEKPIAQELAFSEEDEARLAVLAEQYKKMILPFHGQHFKPSVWKQKPLWERAGRRIIAAIPLSSVWRRYIPAFKYGITPEDGLSLSWQVTTEMAALESKRDANSPATFPVYFTFYTPEETYSDSHAIALKPGEVGTAEYYVYTINMDEDEWSWEHEVSPGVKWVTQYKKVTLFRYLLHALESP